MGFFIRIKNSNYRFFVLLLALLLLQSIIFGSIYLLKGLPYQLILSVIFTTTVCLTPLVFSLIKSKDLLAPPVGVGFMIFFSMFLQQFMVGITKIKSFQVSVII